MIIKGIKEVVKSYCAAKNITIDEFAYKIGVPLPSLNRMLAKEKIPKTETFISLLIVLREDLWKLIEENVNNDRLEEPTVKYLASEANLKPQDEKDILLEILKENKRQTQILLSNQK